MGSQEKCLWKTFQRFKQIYTIFFIKISYFFLNLKICYQEMQFTKLCKHFQDTISIYCAYSKVKLIKSSATLISNLVGIENAVL